MQKYEKKHFKNYYYDFKNCSIYRTININGVKLTNYDMFLRISQYIRKASLKLVFVKYKNLIIELNMKISPKKVLKCKKS